MKAAEGQLTDTLPRASVPQLLATVKLLARTETATFDDVRAALVRSAVRRAPASADSKWTTARDVLSELQRLGFVSGGAIPRQKSVLDRLRTSVFKLTDQGKSLAACYETNRGEAFDRLFNFWLREHPYFRGLLARLTDGPLYVPDITSIKDLNGHAVENRSIDKIALKVAQTCCTRLSQVHVRSEVRERFTQSVHDRFSSLASEVSLSSLDTKSLVDAVEDRVVVPSLLAAESLPFDPVTFQHLIKASQDFFVASWSSSHPNFAGRVVFLTCEIQPRPVMEDTGKREYSLAHHGKSFAWPHFEKVFLASYKQLAGSSRRSYVDSYELRALVCLELAVQPVVFNACLEELLQVQPTRIYTELPFQPPPKGESYVEIARNRTRVGRIKIAAQ